MSDDTPAVALTVEGCRQRQQRLRGYLRGLDAQAALLTHPRHVHYFSGYWGSPSIATAMVIPADGPSVLATAAEPGETIAADERVPFEADRLCTLVDDQIGSAVQALKPHLKGVAVLGCDDVQRPWLLSDYKIENLWPTLLGMRRTKCADELCLIRRAIASTEAAYARARHVLKPGVTEIEVYAAMQEAAVNAVGEPIGPFGNDFQSGAPGGPPRQRPTEAGELMPLDVSVVVRGYSSDLCRTFCVDRQPTAAQAEAHTRVVAALDHVEATVRAGTSCRRLYDEVFKMLDGHGGWRFFHHLGHGIGLNCHEAPRLNPNWDDAFGVGDVFTAEPGLYGDELRAGIRIEQNYLVKEQGLVRLSTYPVEL